MRFKEIRIIEAQQSQTKMSYGRLQQLAYQIPAKVGIEFEMLVPYGKFCVKDVDYEDKDNEYFSSFSDAASFFDDDDVESTLEDMYGEYLEDEWYNVGKDYIRATLSDFWEPDREAILEKVLKDNDISPEKYDASDPLMKFVEDEFRELEEESIDEKLEQVWRSATTEAEEIRDTLYSQWNKDIRDESQWLNDQGIDNGNDMLDFFKRNHLHNLRWPTIKTESDNYNTSDMETDTAIDFAEFMMLKDNFNVGTSYKEAKREPGKYTIEPDPSLNDDDDYAGLEFISYPMPLANMEKDVKDVMKWARKTGCYTDHTCGLHMNVSLDDLDPKNLDYMKLILFLGDKYILEEFKRSSNTFCSSMFDTINDKINSIDENKLKKWMQNLSEKLNAISSRVLLDGLKKEKYSSVNLTKSNYIEFRGPGDDWLSMDEEKILGTLYRYIVALDIASDQSKHKEEYAKKYYSLLSGFTEQFDILEAFTYYSAGLLQKSMLAPLLRSRKNERITKQPDYSDSTQISKDLVSGLSAELKTPESAINYAIRHNSRIPLAEPMIMRDARAAEKYAILFFKNGWPAAEKYIMRNPFAAFRYARAFYKDGWPAAEKYIMRNPKAAVQYAIHIIKKPWPEAEPAIKRDEGAAKIYAQRVLGYSDPSKWTNE